MWREAGITGDRHVAFYCGTGWRASAAFLYACAMGWPRVCVFDGGWLEWSEGPERRHNPIVTGDPGGHGR